MDEHIQRGHTIYDELIHIFDTHSNINELGLIVSVEKFTAKNAAASSSTPSQSMEISPSQSFIVVENNLGVSVGSVPPLYHYCFVTFNTLLDNCKLRNCNDITDEQFAQQIRDYNDGPLLDTLNKLTKVILMVNAENLTALNLRKRLITAGLNTHIDEIKLLNFIFTKHPKSGEAWCHRRWVLHNSKGVAMDIASEMAVCRRVAEIYPKNYYAWTHRWWCLQQQMTVKNLLDDLKMMDQWSMRNISDYCGFNHRSLILRQLYNDVRNGGQCDWQSLLDLWLREFKMIDTFIVKYPGHETLWSHKRLLIGVWMSEILPNSREQLVKCQLLSGLAFPTMISQLEYCQGIIGDTASSYYTEQKTFAQRFAFWILQLSIKLTTSSGNPVHLDEHVIPNEVRQMVINELMQSNDPFPPILVLKQQLQQQPQQHAQ
ncbi:hypothetical protein SAMD00019534_054800 [Acytostelium subglobosum LB1]|uniref:hypothetical protein n=1 Tax=Acytostelium subglobosum LB1 TaxID=1410327 RepID=UPI0006447D58|nr:hypothetical protein SAMD00019534_054800 [Acytostelium subglobosum LB1]GAM22305.1 hypothetical protein SAMD00019534_054800 [Acytostelium subglobosum LB1]|eukprot:XP_012754425.1 hypothetical protein SAMD00019534_054800 [Acytostelium subglobosum LB1]